MREGRTFAVFILTHGRPDNVQTLHLLDRIGWTGPTYLIIDNEDAKGDEYRRRFGDRVIEFDKRAVAQTFDTADTSDDRRAIVYARNVAFDIARDMGLDYFLQLDDDYRNMRWRTVVDGKLTDIPQTVSADALFDAMLDFLDATNADAVAFAQGGDVIGGLGGANWPKGLVRKCMNTIFCRTSRPIGFIGRINEDVNAYVVHGARGRLFLGVMRVQIEQERTQASDGGMSAVYRNAGTYLKSFYTVMMAPSCVTVRGMGVVEQRYHHHVSWDHAVPKILNERYRKAS